MFRRTFAEINLDHIAHNFEILKERFPYAPFLCPMVKANGYGHGDVAVARCLEKVGATHLGVCLIEEALLLRQAGIKAEILVFRGFDFEGAKQMIAHQLTPVVATWDQLESLEVLAKAPISIHIKFNTGMNRLGFSPAEASRLLERCQKSKTLKVQGVLTHLYNGEDADDVSGSSCQQLQVLSKVINTFQPLHPVNHSLNSAGILNSLRVRQQNVPNHPLTQENWGLRPGLMIYGYGPLEQKDILPLRPAMTLKSVASTFRRLTAGEIVSYGGSWSAKEDAIIAVVPIGYADGYRRILSNRAQAVFNNHRVSVIGTVCMDFLMVDVTEAVRGQDLDDLREQEIILFGPKGIGPMVSAEDLAGHAQTITWEILTSVGERVPRVYVGEWAKKLGVAG